MLTFQHALLWRPRGRWPRRASSASCEKWFLALTGSRPGSSCRARYARSWRPAAGSSGCPSKRNNNEFLFRTRVSLAWKTRQEVVTVPHTHQKPTMMLYTARVILHRIYGRLCTVMLFWCSLRCVYTYYANKALLRKRRLLCNRETRFGVAGVTTSSPIQLHKWHAFSFLGWENVSRFSVCSVLCESRVLCKWACTAWSVWCVR